MAASGLTIYKTLMEMAARQRAGVESATKHRIKVKAALENMLGLAQLSSSTQELIILDAARADDYPAPDERGWRLRSISPWFKSEGWQFYSDGLEVGDTQVRQLLIKRGRAEIVHEGGEKGWLGMRIPFGNIIAHQDYDDAYGLPVLWCHFTHKRNLPYESVEVYRERSGGVSEHVEGVRFKNRLTLREVAADVPARIKLRKAQRRFDRDVEAKKRQLEAGD